MEIMLKSANDARAAASAAEKNLMKAEEGLRDLMMKVATQEKDLDVLKAKSADLNKKAKRLDEVVSAHPDNKKSEEKK